MKKYLTIIILSVLFITINICCYRNTVAAPYKKEVVQTIHHIEKTKKAKYVKYPYHISDKGKKHIKQYESCRLKVYTIHGQKTIGWGHLLKSNENYKVISQAKADQLFEKDIHIHEGAMNRLLEPLSDKFHFSQGFIDGFGSLVYNCGEGSVRRSKFYKSLLRCRIDKYTGNINKKDLKYTISIVKKTGVSMRGHIKRREAEYNMMIF